MTPVEFNRSVLAPGMMFLGQQFPRIPRGRDAQALLLAIAGQEGDWTYRAQMGGGPARGYWQFERGGGVHVLLSNPATRPYILEMCRHFDVTPTDMSIWTKMGTPAGDILSVGMARILLYSDPHPLPAAEDYESGWQYYLRNWRPGKPHEEGWEARMDAALNTLDAMGVVP